MCSAIAHSRAKSGGGFLPARAGTWPTAVSGAFGQATQMDAEKFCAQFLPDAVPEDFSALTIPLTVVATDLHRRQEAPFSSGPLRPALAASIAIPGMFRPVVLDGRILIDGGTTNPLPFDKLAGRADIIVAVDVFGAPAAERSDVPSAWESALYDGAGHGRRHRRRQTNHAAPDLMIRPNVAIFRGMDFYQASAIFRAAEAVEGRGAREASAHCSAPKG